MKRTRLFACAMGMLLAVSVYAQPNLIRNGGFEEHGQIECIQCYHLYGRYPAVVYHWDNGGWACQLYDQDYKFTSEENGYNPFKKLAPYAGKCMVELIYLPDCNGIHGAASHLTAPSTQPLLVGREYEVCMQLYIDNVPKSDPEWARHIGIALLPEKIRFHNLSDTRNIPSLQLDTVVYNQWYEVKWRIRPLCNSQYLMIGVFRDGAWPRSQSFAGVRYYVDNVSMREISSDKIAPDSSAYYCSRYDPLQNPDIEPRTDNLPLYFETGSYELTPEHRLLLDTLARFARKYPAEVFEISGHTDNTGADNLALSANRTQAVFNYLTTVCQLPAYRFVTLSRGSTQPVADNNTESGRQLNRRVQVRQSEFDLPAMLYRKALEAVQSGQMAESFALLDKWLRTPDSGSGMVLMFDPRFEALKKDKRWQRIEQKIRSNYQKFNYPEYAFLADSLRLDDRRVLGELPLVMFDYTDYVPGIDSVRLSIPAAPQAVIDQKMRDHFEGFRPILDKIGWPKRSEFGAAASESAFILLQHSLDSAACVRWLPEVQKACEAGEAFWDAFAWLFDRCRIIAGKPQRYGTHSEEIENGRVRLLPCEGDFEQVNAARAKIGLQLLSADWVSM